MLPMETLREWQYQHMRDALATVGHLLHLHDRHALTTYRDGGEGWTVAAVICHLRDFDAVFYERIHLMIEMDYPDLPFPDPDEQAEANGYADTDAQTAYDGWSRERKALMAYMANLSDASWDQTGRHPTRGVFTPHDQLFLIVQHDMLHIEQITRILAEELTEHDDRL